MKTHTPFAEAWADERRAAEHVITIWTRYGETTRECYSSATNRMSHHEDQSPWLSWDDEQKLTDEQRAKRRLDWRLYLFVRDFSSYDLLEYFLNAPCDQHSAERHGEIHFYKQDDKYPAICIPEEDA